MKTIDVLNKLGLYRTHYTVKENLIKAFFKNGYIIYSYDTICAIFITDENKWYLTKYHDYSATTNKHMIKTTGMNLAFRRKMIAKGNIELLNDYER